MQITGGIIQGLEAGLVRISIHKRKKKKEGEAELFKNRQACHNAL